MLRLKLFVVIAVALGGLAVGLTRVLVGLRDEAEAALQAELARADRAYLALQRNSQLELRAMAQGLARSEVVAWLGAIQEYEEDLRALEVEVRRAVPGAVGDERVMGARAAWLAAGKGALLDEIATEVADRVERTSGGDGRRERPRADVLGQARELLVRCSVVAVDDCLGSFSRAPLSERVEALRAQRDKALGVEPDVVLVVDARGVGLAAADVGELPDAGRVGEQIAAVGDALRTRTIVRDIARLPGREGWFELAVAPILEGPVLRGVVLVGAALDRERLAFEGQHLGFDVGWLLGSELALTSLGLDDATALAAELAAARDPSRHELVLGERFVAALVPLGGQVGRADVRVAVIAPRDLRSGGLVAAIAWCWALALAAGVLAFAGISLILRRFFAPLRVIDAGLREIVRGGRPVELALDSREATWASLGQALNAAQAALTGREGREPAERWAQRMGSEGDPPGAR